MPVRTTAHLNALNAPGMKSKALFPDFSWYNLSKWGKLYELLQHIPNCNEIKQLATKYVYQRRY
jgi:hypothetical protein